MGVGAQARIIRKIPARIVGIFVDDDLIAIPVPVGHDVVIESRDVPIKIIEPEASGTSASESPHVPGAETAGETTVRPGVFEMIMHVITTSFVANPTVVTGVYVGDAGMAFSFRCYMVLIGMFLRPGGLRMLLRRCM